MLAFVLSLGVATAAPAVQAGNLSPDQQLVCVGNGGMKIVTFAADGSAQEADSAHGLDCSMCGALQALPFAGQYQHGLEAACFAEPIWTSSTKHLIFESRAPPARAPPIA